MNVPPKSSLDLLNLCSSEETFIANPDKCNMPKIRGYINDVSGTMMTQSAYINDVSGRMVNKAVVLTAIDKIVGGFSSLLTDYDRLKEELKKCNVSYDEQIYLRKNLIDEYKDNLETFNKRCVSCVDTMDTKNNTVKVNNLKALHMYSLIQKDKGKIKLFISIITVVLVLLVLRFYHLI